MSKYTVTISSHESERDFVKFLKDHKDVKAISTETIQYDPDIYDEDGNFQWISLAKPGLPVPDEYLLWRLEHSNASKNIPWHEAKAQLKVVRKQYKSESE